MDYKNVPDMTPILEFTIPGRPATKKTHQQIIRTKSGPRIIPSTQYLKYEKECKKPCLEAWAEKGLEPLDFGIGIIIKVYLDSYSIGDETGYQQSIGDIIEHYDIIANDKYLHWLSDGKHMINIDKENPRMEIKLYRFRHPYEAYAEAKAQLELDAQIKRDKRKNWKNNKKDSNGEETEESKPKAKRTRKAKAVEKPTTTKEEKPAKTPRQTKRKTTKKTEPDLFDNLEWMNENQD